MEQRSTRIVITDEVEFYVAAIRVSIGAILLGVVSTGGAGAGRDGGGGGVRRRSIDFGRVALTLAMRQCECDIRALAGRLGTG